MSKFTDEILRLAQVWVEAEKNFLIRVYVGHGGESEASLAGKADAAKTALRDHCDQNGPDDDEEEPPTYKIVRKHRDRNKDDIEIKTGISLAEAKEHCSDPDTKGDGWFDAFYEE